MLNYMEKPVVKERSFSLIASVVVAVTCFVPLPAAAYLGPGAGISAIGSILAILAAVVVAIFGFLWYPLKRFMRKKKKPGKVGETEK